MPMRKLKSLHAQGASVQDVLNEFNERAEEFGITEKDVVSVNITPDASKGYIKTGEKLSLSKVDVTIVYWAKE